MRHDISIAAAVAIGMIGIGIGSVIMHLAWYRLCHSVP